MRKNWISLLGCLALAAGQTKLMAQDDETVPAAAAEPTPVATSEAVQAPIGTSTVPMVQVQPAPADPVLESVDSSALGFWKVAPTGVIENAQRTTVRVARSGRIVQTRRVGEGGVAQISQVAPGAYTVLANGGEGFAAFGAYLGDASHTVSSRVGLVPQRDAQVVLSLIRTNLANGAAGNSSAPAKPVTRASADANSSFEIQSDGSVQGQIVRATAADEEVQPIADLFVAFVRNGAVVNKAYSDINGDFTVTGLDAGVYSLAVAGPGGFAAFSTEVIQPEPHAQARVKRFQFVALRAGSGSTVIPASPEDIRLLSSASGNNGESNPAGVAAMGGPGAGGGFGGGAGGGAGGGGGGLGGGLLGAALGAAAGYAAGQNNGGNNPPSTPAAP